MTSAVGGSQEVHSEHRGRWVIHGPVVYADSVYETLSQAEDEVSRIAALMFTKSETHAAMREYRFVILRDHDAAERVRLRISGMMRDALAQTKHGLVRVSPAPAQAAPAADATDTSRSNQSSQERLGRATSTERVAERTSRELVTKGADGRILASESERHERVQEKTVTHDFDPENGKPAAVGREDARHDTRAQEDPGDRTARSETAPDDKAAVKELAIGRAAETEEAGSEYDRPTLDGGAGQILGWLKEDVEDPAYPTPSTSEPSAEAAVTPEEVHRMYGFVATLGHKVTLVSPEQQQKAASACWHAIQCIRNIFVRLGDIVATASIEHGRFVVLELKESQGLQANGRIAVAPGGAYAYCLKLTNKQRFGGSEGTPGMVFFPMRSQLEDFDAFGWRTKETPRDGVSVEARIERGIDGLHGLVRCRTVVSEYSIPRCCSSSGSPGTCSFLTPSLDLVAALVERLAPAFLAGALLMIHFLKLVLRWQLSLRVQPSLLLGEFQHLADHLPMLVGRAGRRDYASGNSPP